MFYWRILCTCFDCIFTLIFTVIVIVFVIIDGIILVSNKICLCFRVILKLTLEFNNSAKSLK